MAYPVPMVLEVRSPISGKWSTFEAGEFDVADAVLNDGSSMARMSMTGQYVTVVKDGLRYECRLTPRREAKP